MSGSGAARLSLVAMCAGAVVACGSGSDSSGSPVVDLAGQVQEGTQPSQPRDEPSSAPGQGACPGPGAPAGTCPPGAGCSRPDFAPAVTYPVSMSRPTYLEVADFDGDMVADLAVANSTQHVVDVLLASGDGTLGAAISYDTGGAPRALVRGDFDGDLVADLVVSSADTAPIQWLRGNGDGTLQAPVETPVAGGGYLLNRGEFNGDGTLDLAGVSFAGYPVQLFLGVGDGTFTAGSTGGVVTNPQSIFVTDMNGDGLADVVISSEPESGLGGEVRVVPVAANGTLGAPNIYPIAGPGQVRPGDFDGDGKLDLIGGVEADIDLLFGAAGGFAPAVAMPVGGRSIRPIRSASFGGAGTSGVALGDWRFQSLAIYVGEADRSLRFAGAYSVGAAPLEIRRGDFNGDGLVDLAVALDTDPGTVAILLQRPPPAGCFGVGRTLPTCPPSWPTRCEETAECCGRGATCDLDGCDGFTPPCDESSFECPDGHGCCPIGYACVDDYQCEYVGLDPPSPLDCDGWCPPETVCTPDGTCCPDDYPVACGDACCLAGASCDAGECGCPPLTSACGDVCCGYGTECVDGACAVACPDAEYPRSCGASCCADGISCTDGVCACPGGYEPACAPPGEPLYDICCLEGAPCADGVCGCPDGRPPCDGVWCCNAGYACDGTSCVESGGGGSCPSFDDLCSCSGCMAGTVAKPCDCPAGTTEYDEIGCGPGETTGCLQCVCP